MKKLFAKYTEWFNSVFLLSKVLWRLLSDALPGNRSIIGSIGGFAFIMAVLPVGSSYVYSKVIGSLSVPSERMYALMWFWAAIGLSMSIVLLGVFRSYLEKKFYIRMTFRFTMIYLEKKSAVDMAKLEEPASRDLIAKAQERYIWPCVNLLDAQPENIANIIGMASALAIVTAFDPWFSFAICISLIPQFLVDVYYGKTLWTIWDGETEERRWYGEQQRQFTSRPNLIELRLFQNVKHFLGKIREMLLVFDERQARAERMRHGLSVGSSVVVSATVASVLYWSVRRVVSGEMDLQKLVFLWGSITGLQGTFARFLKSISDQTSVSLYAKDALGVIDMVKESEVKKGMIAVSDRIPIIEFKDVWFKYPWIENGAWVLKGVSFVIRPGEKLALVGLNGAGKTTIVKLLIGIYEPDRGEITVDGIPLRDISIESWRRVLSVLFQEFTRYHGMVREIVSYGDTSVPIDDRRMKAALRSSGCDSFVPDLPRGIKAVIGRDFENGIELSGGQNQRLALARIWYRQGGVVILDEPTASLDAFAEMKIFGEIESRKSGETIILITHRMFSVMKAEHIVVLDDGKVAEEGTHHTLMQRKGVYREMFESQARPYLEAMKAYT